MRKILLSLTAMLCACFAFAQNMQVSGIVTDADSNEPMVGVAVAVEGTTDGTVTDMDGAYSISVPSNAKLTFQFLGYESKTIAVEGKKVINVTLLSDALEVEEVLVTAVGIQRSERSLGYSVTKIQAEEAVMKAEPDMLRALDGKVAGIQVAAPSGDAGGATRITIRGNSSFTGDNQPLYVVDGIPYSNMGTSDSGRGAYLGGAHVSGISTLDPNDIESMSILKGAAAAVLYGSRAANGVILITTKSGSKNKSNKSGFNVTLNASYAMEKIASLPEYQNTYGQGSDFQIGSTNGSWGAKFEEGMTQNMYSDVAKYYPELALQMYPELGGKIPYQAYPNNVSDLFDTGHIFDTSANIQSYNEDGNFNVTISRTEQTSYIPGSDFERISFSVGGNKQLENGFRFGGNMSYSYTDQQSPMYGYNQSSEALGGASSLGRAFIMPRSWDLTNFPYATPDGANLLMNLSAQANNPYWAWENDKILTVQKRVVANFNAGYDITKWLAVDYKLGYNDYIMDRKTILNLGSRGNAGKGYISKSNNQNGDIESILLLTADKKFGDLNVKATLGHNYTQSTYEGLGASGDEIINPNIFAIDNTQNQTASESYSRSRKWGVFMDVVLDYKQWAFLNISGRNDVSSTLPIENNSYFYPAVAGSVVFTDALGIQDGVMNFGKVRASWARVGNDASPYYNNGTYGIYSPYMGQGMMGLSSYQIDENLKPEFTSEFEGGIDLKFFEDRVAFEGTYYNRVSDNQIGAKSTASTTGYSSLITNFGSMRNSGIELGLDLYPVFTNDFQWSVYTVFTKNKSEVLELANGIDKLYVGGDFANPRPVLMVGQPYGILEGEKLARTEDGIPLVDPSTGMYINDTEVGIIGDPNPDYKLAMTNTLTYKGVSLSVMMDYQKGGCVYSSYLTDLLGRGVTKDTEDREGLRIINGVYGDANTLQPILDAEGNYIQNTTTIQEDGLWFSDGTFSTFAINSVDEVAVYDATVLRLREVTLGYSIPKKYISKLKLNGAEVSFVGRNLWFWAPNVPKYSNYDPTANSYGETNVQGIDYTSAPSTKRFAFNLKLTF